MKLMDLSGKKYGRLTVLERAPYKMYGRHIAWLCECECGGHTVVTGNSLQQGNVASCGCLGVETKKSMHVKHGDCGTRLYQIYHNMKRRCYDRTTDAYKYYGERGIRVCNEWASKDGYPAFKKWALSSGYSDGLSIDRIDNDGNYEPSNCRWVLLEEQQNNTRQNQFFTYNGKTQTIAQWSRETGIPYECLRKRLVVRRWGVEQALTTPN